MAAVDYHGHRTKWCEVHDSSLKQLEDDDTFRQIGYTGSKVLDE
jgi:hypothetical protein